MFPSSVSKNSAAMNIGVQTSESLLLILWGIPKNGIARLYGNYTFNLEEPPKFFTEAVPILHL